MENEGEKLWEENKLAAKSSPDFGRRWWEEIGAAGGQPTFEGGHQSARDRTDFERGARVRKEQKDRNVSHVNSRPKSPECQQKMVCRGKVS